MQLCLRRADGHAELVADVLVSPTLDIVQDENRASAGKRTVATATENIPCGSM